MLITKRQRLLILIVTERRDLSYFSLTNFIIKFTQEQFTQRFSYILKQNIFSEMIQIIKHEMRAQQKYRNCYFLWQSNILFITAKKLK